MRGRIGVAVYWVGVALAMLILAFGAANGVRFVVDIVRGTPVPRPYVLLLSMVLGVSVFAAAIPWLIGLACRWLLCPDSHALRTSIYAQLSRVCYAFLWLWLIWTGVVALSAITDGRLAFEVAVLMLAFLGGFSSVFDRYIDPLLRRWADAASIG